MHLFRIFVCLVMGLLANQNMAWAVLPGADATNDFKRTVKHQPKTPQIVEIRLDKALADKAGETEELRQTVEDMRRSLRNVEPQQTAAVPINSPVGCLR